MKRKHTRPEGANAKKSLPIKVVYLAVALYCLLFWAGALWLATWVASEGLPL